MSMTFTFDAATARRARAAEASTRKDHTTLVTIALFALVFAASLFFVLTQPQLSPADGLAFVTSL